MKKRLVLIDGHAILHRAYHALPKSLTNRHGQLVNAVYGFTRMLLRVIEDLGPFYLAVTFDRPEPTFRHREFIGYQIQRPKMDEALKDQIEIIREVLSALALPVFEKNGFEADDIIGTLAFQARVLKRKTTKQSGSGRRSSSGAKSRIETIIVTADRDIFQLINDSTLVYAPIKGFSEARLFDAEGVKESLGVWPDQIVDYKALMGDSSDNYPGVPGIGPKTAVRLLESFGSLENIYLNLDKLPVSVARKLKEGKESALLSQKLARITIKAPVKLILKKCRLADYDREKALTLFKKLGFKSLMNKLPGDLPDSEREGEKEQIRRQLKLV
ncbi:MAG: hypothetical protein JW991_04825 [Candidatus Pacebacteria bacterium]|nr:hypothetical protein [Candidatus Paceibacterota bacterium]